MTMIGIDVALEPFKAVCRQGLGKLAQPVRAALTGKTTSPGIFDVLALLGRDESLARIGDRMTATAGIE